MITLVALKHNEESHSVIYKPSQFSVTENGSFNTDIRQLELHRVELKFMTA